jgi:cytochrome P450
MSVSPLFEPPHPRARSALPSLVRAMVRDGGDLLSLLPAQAYRMGIGPLGWSRRSTIVVNSPDLVRRVLIDDRERFPKSDLMVNALDPLIGNSMFVSDGDTWLRQRRLMDPSLSQMRIDRAMPAMQASLDDAEQELSDRADRKESFSLDLAMSHLTADIICRTVFSTSLKTQTTHEVFEAFSIFERSVAQVNILRLIFDPAWTKPPQRPDVLTACTSIRNHLGELLDTHLVEGADFDDIAAAVVAARDECGQGFSRDELIDQLGVLFLAGHETSASALTWVFYLLAIRPELVQRIRTEVKAVVGDGPIGLEHVKRLSFVRNVFRETVRLYPPITFLPRVALESTRLGDYPVKRGALVIVSPWVMHRHTQYWRDPHRFDPDRFSPEREVGIQAGTYLPFGLGPRVCSGAAFATVEATLVIARLIRDFNFEVVSRGAVRPAARLTTRPAHQIVCRVTRVKE